MDIVLWIVAYLLSSLFWLWMLRWGGAASLAGWKAWAVIGWFSGHWSAEQIRLYALILFILETIGFIAGLFSPTVRLAWLEI